MSRLETLESGEKSDWQQFRSLNFPYQIDFPNGWIGRSVREHGKKQDIFTQNNPKTNVSNLSISCEPVADWAKPEDYAQNVLNQLKVNADKDAKIIGKEDIALDSLQNTKVAGEKVIVISYDRKSPTLSRMGNKHSLMATFVYQGNAWSLNFEFKEDYYNPPYEKAYLDRVNQFRGMLSSFTLNK